LKEGGREEARERSLSSLLEAVKWRHGPPEVRLAEVGVAKGMKVADIGAGYGFFAFPAAEMVGEEGVVYAVEPDPRRAGQISKTAITRGAKNVKVLNEKAEAMEGIPTGSVDIAISMSSFHHFSDKRKSLLEMRRIVKPGGLIHIRDVKAGRLFRHGSKAEEFRKSVASVFPGAVLEEGSGHLVAKARAE
jgi:FkbM family methyltransferase